MKLDIFKSPVLKRGLGVASVIFTGIVAVTGAVSDRKKEQEFEDMKKAISELQNK